MGAKPKSNMTTIAVKKPTRNQRSKEGTPFGYETATTLGIRTARPLRSNDLLSFECTAPSARNVNGISTRYNHPHENNASHAIATIPAATSTSTKDVGFP